jgi:uncharacterized protein (DUF305 family)
LIITLLQIIVGYLQGNARYVPSPAGMGFAIEFWASSPRQFRRGEFPVRRQRWRTNGTETVSKHKDDTGKAMMHGSYARFGAMIATSTLVMLGLMYLNTYELEHVFWSETRAYMALVMGASMAVVMLTFMLGMYPHKAWNAGIYLVSVGVFAVALYLVRSQATVEDVSYMRAMIPHHSIAVLTSERAEISDPRLRKLADEIIDAQRREIDEMKALIEELENQP